MITVANLLEKKTESCNIIHVLSELPSTKEVSNLIHSMSSQSGKKHIFHTKAITPEIKSHYQNAVPNHKHFFQKDGEVSTVMDAVDRLKDDRPVKIMTHPNQVDGLSKTLKKTHPDKNISVEALLHNKEKPKTAKDFHPSIKTSDAKKMLGESLEIGEFVTNGTIEGEIVVIHPTYAIIVSEGNQHRIWTRELEISEHQPKRNQLYKESFIYKSYKTKNMNRVLSEEFKSISSAVEDEYAVLECLKVFDYILGVTDKTISENFKTVRIQTERLKRYSKKIGASYLTESVVNLVEEELLKYAILEGVKFTTTDQVCIARVIAFVSGMPLDTSISPGNTITQAFMNLRTKQLTTQGWEIVGRLVLVAQKANIKVNLSAFSDSQLRMMRVNK